MDTRLVGCGTALATPFTAGGAIHERALRDFVEWQLDEGIDFLRSQRNKHFDPKCVDAFLADRTRIEAIYSELAD